MKKFLPFAVGIFFIVTIFYACNVSQQPPKVEKEGDVCNNYLGKKPTEMNKQYVVDMISNYYTNQYAALNDAKSSTKLKLPTSCPEDSRAIFFNLDSLKKLLYYIEVASKDFSQKEKENLGVNIYFASYPKEFNKVHNGSDYTNRQTLIFIPSMFDQEKGLARDLNIAENIYKKSPKPTFIDAKFFANILPPNNTKGVRSLNRTPAPLALETIISLNDGTGTPPPPHATIDNPLLSITDPN